MNPIVSSTSTPTAHGRITSRLRDIVDALDRGTYISPSGNVTIKDQMTVVPSNTMVVDPQELRSVPLKLGENVYIRDVGTVADATNIPVGYALVNGKKSVYLPIVKQASASTLSVVNAVKTNLARFQAALTDDVKATRTLQTEIDVPNTDGDLHPGWYVTVSIVVHRKQVWALPSNAIAFGGQQNYFVYFDVDNKPVRTPVIVGPSDDT